MPARAFLLLLLFVSSLACAQTHSSAPAATTVAPCALNQPSPALPLSTNGRFIVDANGRRFKLSGVAWYGAEGDDFVVGGLQLEPLVAIAHRIRCLGFNAVRLPWSNEMSESNPIVPNYALTANPDLMGKRALVVYDRVVQALAAEGLMVILDNHNSNAEWCCGSDGNELWYNSDYSEADWIADWKGMVSRYRSTPQVVAADLRNELRSPATWGGDPTTDWHGAAERGGAAVLATNPKLLIMVEGINYALDLTGVANLPVKLPIANRLVYSPHDYPFDHNGLVSSAALAAALDQAWGYIANPGQTYTAPLWLGEFGNCHTASLCVTDTATGSSGLWFASIRQYLSQKDIDWSWWAINGTETSGAGRTFGSEETYGILNPYWNAPALPNELNPQLNVAGALATIAQPNQGPKLAASYAPLVSLTQPLPGSTIVSGSTLNLSANATLVAGSADSIRQVDFYANGAKIGTATASPYSFAWANIAPGAYSVEARVTTTAGKTARSQAIPVQAINYVARAVSYTNAIGVNFVSYAVTPMAASESAGVVTQTNWNQAGIANAGTLPGLVDAHGQATSAAVSWTSPNTYFTAILDQPGNNRMMKGYLDNNNTVPNTVGVSALPSTFKTYDVIAYFDGGNESGSSTGPTRSANFRLTSVDKNGVHGCAGQTIEGSTIMGTDAGGVDFAGSFLQASGGSSGNYVFFADCTGSSFELRPVHGGTTDDQVRAPINGLQVLAH